MVGLLEDTLKRKGNTIAVLAKRTVMDEPSQKGTIKHVLQQISIFQELMQALLQGLGNLESALAKELKQQIIFGWPDIYFGELLRNLT